MAYVHISDGYRGLGLGGGFAPMAEPLAELYEEEPEDVHLSKRLSLTCELVRS